MIVSNAYEIDSCDDVELDIKRQSKLEFKLCFDDEKEIKALVFIIPGLGGDANENYRDHLAETVARELGVGVVSVNYHCIGNRPQTGSSFYLDEIDKLILKASCEAIDIKLAYNVDKIQSYEQMSEIFHFINDNITKGKEEGRFMPDYFLNLHVSLNPTKNEYQNFGIMQTQDLLNVVLYLKKQGPFKAKDLPVVMVGSSHGGYLAHLAAKIAPWLVDGIIDNSSYAKFLWRLVGFGKEIDFIRYSEFNTFDFFQHIRVHCSSKTFWTNNSASKYFFSPARRMIRNILEPTHLQIQARYPKPYYISYHSYYDKKIAPPEDKIQLYQYFKDLGFDAKLNMIKDPHQVDGKFIKNLDHGMQMSIKTLISKELLSILEKTQQKSKIDQEKCIVYPCENLIYSFSEEDDKISLKIDKV
ncbi:DUF2920 family protein [Campylobacter sp. VicNov18]|uniref:DUF2920 family protein n=1 Tax=Campylobacter bilis TaxID=2691918 RepID=UPI00130E67EB|nr:DUF2920 family protein [Campylobacter bilis]MPV64236.1 DUF2920 family protein [Campylobacter hepaticus]MBM0637741.1 DUF2920 family protein [Campylobacter bilis]MCC8278467.1 DUF2920 family protein [Campylobacter bilis]MCC8299971.1 DUF2920 family protein [Campylobacter bilis]MCC8301376.1 DUF2920 family protein [Campylobacter bilis]